MATEKAKIVTVAQILEPFRLPAVADARAGNLELLISYVQLGGAIRDDVREVIVDILKGELKRAKHRPSKAQTLFRAKRMFWRLTELQAQGARTESAVAQVAEEFGVSGKTVYRALKQFRHKQPPC
jgi:hypothetical protein